MGRLEFLPIEFLKIRAPKKAAVAAILFALITGSSCSQEKNLSIHLPPPQPIEIVNPKTPDALSNKESRPVTDQNSGKMKRQLEDPDRCFRFTYTHASEKKRPKHSKEDCLEHSNAIELRHKLNSEVNKDSLCVRSAGIPIAYSISPKKENRIQIQPGPTTQKPITVDYCLGKAQCKQDCLIPKDEFMDAIGGTVAHENSEDQDYLPLIDAVVQRELSLLDHPEASQEFASDGTILFTQWKSDGGSAICKKQSKSKVVHRTTQGSK